MEKSNPRVIKDIAEAFLTLTEERYIKNIEIEYHTALLIAFSAKESLFKALYPLTKIYFGFDAARISKIEEKSRFFTMELLVSLSKDFPIGSQYRGCYKIYKGYIITVISTDGI